MLLGCVLLSQAGDTAETWREVGDAELLPWHQLRQTTPPSLPSCWSEKIGAGCRALLTRAPLNAQGISGNPAGKKAIALPVGMCQGHAPSQGPAGCHYCPQQGNVQPGLHQPPMGTGLKSQPRAKGHLHWTPGNHTGSFCAMGCSSGCSLGTKPGLGE